MMELNSKKQEHHGYRILISESIIKNRQDSSSGNQGPISQKIKRLAEVGKALLNRRLE